MKGAIYYVAIATGDIFTCEDIKFSRESSPSISLVACVASGSSRVRRENWNESKKRPEFVEKTGTIAKKGMKGEGEGERSEGTLFHFFFAPAPSFALFALRKLFHWCLFIPANSN